MRRYRRQHSTRENNGAARGLSSRKNRNPGSRLLWLALEEAVTQLNRYVRLLNFMDGSRRRLFPTATAWIIHVKRSRTRTAKKRGR